MTGDLPERLLVFDGPPGLANRLVSWAGWTVVGEEHGFEVAWAWPRTLHCPDDRDELFLPHPSFIADDDALPAIDGRVVRRTPVSLPLDEYRRRWTPNLGQDEFRDRAAAHLRTLRPRPALAAVAEQCASEHALDGQVGLHLRWTDNRVFALMHRTRPAAGYDPTAFPRFADFLATVERVAEPGQGIWVCTDNPRAHRRLARRTTHETSIRPMPRRPWLVFDPRAGRASRLWVVSRRPTSVADALVDMLTLARCQTVVSPHWSNFGVAASLLGGRPLVEVRRRPIVAA